MMALQTGSALGGSFGIVEQDFGFSNVHESLGIINLLDVTLAPAGVATSSATQTHTLPAGAIVLRATYTITAKAAGLVTIGSVAQVREAKGNELVVDFQGMRTVDRVQAPKPISSITPWAGTQFDGRSAISNGSTAVQEFTEIQTERLLVSFTGAVSADALAAQGSATVLTPPADLELVVDGTRAWFNAGPARPGGSEGDPAAFQTTVDVTAAVAAAVAAAKPDADGNVEVDVVLNSSVPGQLTLAAAVQFQRTFVVAFPEGDARVIEAGAEGVYELLLPLPDAAEQWQIHEVRATVSAALPPLRVLRPDGPTISGDAELVLDADHSVLVGLPPASLAQLETLSAVRLIVGVDQGGAELAGVLRADAGGAPGEPLKQGQLGPVTLAAGELDHPAWTTLALAKEHKLAPNERLWLGLQLARGRLSWPLAVPAPPPADARALPADAPLRRQLPNGAFRPLSSAGDVATTAAAIRVAGEAPDGSPIEALELVVAGREVGLAFTPTKDGAAVTIGLEHPLTKTETPAAFDATGALRLQLTTKTPGSFSFAAVRIAYTDAGGSA